MIRTLWDSFKSKEGKCIFLKNGIFSSEFYDVNIINSLKYNGVPQSLSDTPNIDIINDCEVKEILISRISFWSSNFTATPIQSDKTQKGVTHEKPFVFDHCRCGRNDSSRTASIN